MSKQDPGKSLLENAYQLQSPEDNIAYYGALAESYDQDFADGLGYSLPLTVAERYRTKCSDEDVPVLDVGCGTGLLAVALNMPGLIIDGLDISDTMLGMARKKNRYRHLIEADLTRPLSIRIESYGAVLSCGTFTHGHVGPDAVVRLLEIATNGALFVLSVNKAHYKRLGFESVTTMLADQQRIIDLNTEEVKIYSSTEHEHSDDTGLILSFRKI